MVQSRVPSRPGRATPFVFPLVLALAVSPACHRSGGDGPKKGIGGPTVEGPLTVDFGFRRDLKLGAGFLSDALTLDVNGDGLVDLVEASFKAHAVTVSFGSVDGTFLSAHRLATIGGPWRLALGDVDGNGQPDVVVACLSDQGAGEAGLQVFLQGPYPGDFAASASLPTATPPIDLAVAPLSGVPGDLGPFEIFVADRDGGFVQRYQMDGAGSLQATGRLETTALGATSRPISVAAIDVGGDGWIDVATGEIRVSSGAPDRIVVHPRDAVGFQDPVVVLAPVYDPIVDAVGDVDGNGFEDLGIAQLSSSSAVVLAGDGTGFYRMVGIDFEGITTSLVFGDLDGNGWSDVAATVLDHDSVNVQLATGPLAWDGPTRYNVGNLPRALGLVQLPGDAIPDLVCANGDDFSILVGTGGGAFRGARGYPTDAEGPVAVDVGDLDEDGDLDAALVTAGQTAIVFLEGDGAGGMSEASLVPLTPSGENYGAVEIADMDRDGRLDVLCTVLQSNELRLFRNLGAIGRFTTAPEADVYPTGSSPIGLAVADLDDDGFPDAIVGDAGDRTVRVLRGSGGGRLAYRGVTPVGARPGVLRAMDFDGDGDVDVALTTGGDGTANGIVVLAGDGEGGLVPVWSAATDTLGSTLDLADLDGDGLVDLVVGQPGVLRSDLFLVRNLGGMSFQARRLTVGPDPGVVLARDVDRDGHVDLLVGSATSDLRIAYGDGSGGFPRVEGDKGVYPLPFGTVAGAFEDLDRDGLEDLLLVSPSCPLLWIGANESFRAPQN